MRLLFVVATLCCSFCTIVGRKISFLDCGSEFQVDEVHVTPCPSDQDYCPLYLGHNTSITIKFKPTREVKRVRTVVHGIKLGLPMRFAVPRPNACVDSGLTCPLQKDQLYTYSRDIYVSPSYPEIAIDVQWTLRGPAETQPGEQRPKKSSKLVCVILNTQLKTPPAE